MNEKWLKIAFFQFLISIKMVKLAEKAARPPFAIILYELGLAIGVYFVIEVIMNVRRTNGKV